MDCGPMAAVDAALRGARRVLVATHVHPDGDALGSQLALCGMLRRLGKEAVAAGSADDINEALAFLDTDGLLDHSSPGGNEAFDWVVALDAASFDRLPGNVAAVCATVPVINIDHHASNPGFGVIDWIDPRAAAVGEMLCALAMRHEWEIGRNEAECLWVALVTDTGRFGYEQTRPETLEAAAWLLRHEVRVTWINERLFGRMPRPGFEVRRRMLASIRFLAGGKGVLSGLRNEDFAEAGCTPRDVDNLLDWPRAVDGVEVAVLLYETGEAELTRLSLRTKAPWNAADFCRAWSGGGHPRAAGATLPMPIDQAMTAVEKRLIDWLRG